MSNRPLDLFPVEYDHVLARVRDNGKFFVTLNSKREVATMKMDFYRFRNSLLEFEPDGWRAAVARDLMIKLNDRSMEFCSKSDTSALEELRAALTFNPEGTTDVEAAKVQATKQRALGSLDEFEKRLQEQYPPEQTQ